MSIHAIVTKRFDVASISGLTSGTPMLRRLPTRFLVALSIALLAAAPLHAYMHGQKGQHDQREHKRTERTQIVALEQQSRQATLADDVPTMDKLLSDDYLGITASGEVLTKTQQLDRMRERKLVITTLMTSEVKIKLVGNIAIVTSLAQVEGSDNDEPLHGAFRYTRVYQRMPGGIWKVTSFEVTPTIRLHPADSPQG
jgi:ketosteroid isomerase-like protein